MFNGKTHYKWPFSIAMLVYQRVGVILLGKTDLDMIWWSVDHQPWFKEILRHRVARKSATSRASPAICAEPCRCRKPTWVEFLWSLWCSHEARMRNFTSTLAPHFLTGCVIFSLHFLGWDGSLGRSTAINIPLISHENPIKMLRSKASGFAPFFHVSHGPSRSIWLKTTVAETPLSMCTKHCKTIGPLPKARMIMAQNTRKRYMPPLKEPWQ